MLFTGVPLSSLFFVRRLFAALNTDISNVELPRGRLPGLNASYHHVIARLLFGLDASCLSQPLLTFKNEIIESQYHNCNLSSTPINPTTMAESIATPRINASYLDSFTGQTIRITGKVVQLRGEEATIDAAGNVTAHLNRVCIWHRPNGFI
jgi:hypothetical protein